MVAVVVVEGVPVGIIAEDELVVVLKDLFKGEVVARSVNTEQASNGADNDLVDPVIFEQEWPFVDDEAH